MRPRLSIHLIPCYRFNLRDGSGATRCSSSRGCIWCAIALCGVFAATHSLAVAQVADQPTATSEPNRLPQNFGAVQTAAASQAGGTAPVANTNPTSTANGLRPSSPPEAWTGAAHTPSVSFSAGSNPPLTTGPADEKRERSRIPLKDPNSDATDKQTKTAADSSLRPLMSMVTSLLIVLGLFFAVVWFYRKTTNNPVHGVPKQVVQVLGRAPLATRQSLVLIRFGSKLVLVSLAPGETRTLCELTDPIEVDQLAGLCESNSPTSLTNSFLSILNQGGNKG